MCVGNNFTIEKCVNYGYISGNGNKGGIIACVNGSGKIISCKNYGEVIGGGIINHHRDKEVEIINCINYGKVQGGIVNISQGAYWSAELKLSIVNCCNLGEVSANGFTGGIISSKGTVCAKNITIIKNCFNSGNITSAKNNAAKSIIANISCDTAEKYYHELYNVYGTGELMGTVSKPNYNRGEAIQKTLEEMQNQDFVNKLNIYVNTYNEEHKNDEGFIELKRWKYNAGSYPTFE